jgi:predicted RNase H-like nuclease (RuvC/YqgF family)
VEQLEFKMEKMGQQAENDRSFIEGLTDKNRRLEQELHDLQREKRMLEVEVRRLQLGDDTQKDCFTELEMVRKEKEVLERNLRELTSNLMTKVRTSYKEQKIEDSGELLRP